VKLPQKPKKQLPTEREGNRGEPPSSKLSQRTADNITTENEQNGKDISGMRPLYRELAGSHACLASKQV
jgi:hypothetical protein